MATKLKAVDTLEPETLPDDSKRDIGSALDAIENMAKQEAAGEFNAAKATFDMARHMAWLARGGLVTPTSLYDLNNKPDPKGFTPGQLAAQRRAKWNAKLKDADSIKNFGSSLQTCLAVSYKNQNLLPTLDRVFQAPDKNGKNAGPFFAPTPKKKRMFGAAYAIVRAVGKLPDNSEIAQSLIAEAIKEAPKKDRLAYAKAKSLFETLTKYVNGKEGSDKPEDQALEEFQTKAWKATLASMDIAFGEMPEPEKKGKDGKVVAAKKTSPAAKAKAKAEIFDDFETMSDEQALAYIRSRR